MSRISIPKNGAYGLLRIDKADREKLERLLFHRYPDKEWGSFFRFGFRRTTWGIALTFAHTLKPELNDLDRASPLVEFRPSYIHRALESLETNPLGVGVIHSHPQPSGSGFTGRHRVQEFRNPSQARSSKAALGSVRVMRRQLDTQNLLHEDAVKKRLQEWTRFNISENY